MLSSMVGFQIVNLLGRNERIRAVSEERRKGMGLGIEEVICMHIRDLQAGPRKGKAY